MHAGRLELGAALYARPTSSRARCLYLGEEVDSSLEAAIAATADALAASDVASTATSSVDHAVFDVKALAGVSAPLGFWDPAGFSDGTPETKMRCALLH